MKVVILHAATKLVQVGVESWIYLLHTIYVKLIVALESSIRALVEVQHLHILKW